MPNPIFEKWATGYSGCDGGDIGTPEHPAIWFCGIEWGGGKPSDKSEQAFATELLEWFQEDVSAPAIGYEDQLGNPDWSENLAYIFNWQAMKLLSAINGGHVSDYKKFAENEQPFVKGGRGYYKMNLYPLAFKNTSHALWQGAAAIATGFDKKQNYEDWICENRFPVMKSWMQRYAPKLIICTGITYAGDFKRAFVDDGCEFTRNEPIDGKELNWCVNRNGTVVVNIPFMVNRYGLTRNASIQKFGEKIREIMSEARGAARRPD